MHARLREVAPRAAAAIEPGDRSRIVRALELAEIGELPDAPPEESELWTDEARRPTALVGLVMDRETLYEAIDRRVHLLKLHLPYHESDHVLNIAYNALCDGTCLDDIELRRNDEVFLITVGSQFIASGVSLLGGCNEDQEQDCRRHRWR